MRALGAWFERWVLGWREPYDPKCMTLDNLKRLSDDGIEALIAAERVSHMQGGGYRSWGEAAKREVERRNQIRQGLPSWAAVFISLAALLVAIVALVWNKP